MLTTTKLIRPWEKVGVSVPAEGQLRTSEALRLTNTDWTVEKVSLVTAPKMVRASDGSIDTARSENSDLFNISNPQMCMTVRSDTRSYLGTVGKGYKIVQNTDYCKFFDEALGADSACITGVGTLGKYGSRVFMVATLPNMLEILPSEPIERHILLTNTHDGTGPVEALFIAWDKERDTMLHAPGGKVKIRHTKNAQRRINTAHTILYKNDQYWARIQRAFAYMAKRDVGDARVRDFLSAMFPDTCDQEGEDGTVEPGHTSHQAQAKRDEIMSIFEETSNGLPKNDWGLYNSVALFIDHKRKLSKSHVANGISQWEISVFGPGAALRDRAFNWLTR